MKNIKFCAIPMSTILKFDNDIDRKSVDVIKVYLTRSRLDIIFSVYLCARIQAIPKQFHLNANKRIFKYFAWHLELEILVS